MHDVDAVATLRYKEARADLAVFSVPGTDYELHLVPDSTIAVEPGKRIKGVIHATALRMHPAEAGGQFIEPIYGPPRIVQGIVMRADTAKKRVLMDMCVPVWVTLHGGNDIAAFHPGDTWNCYVESGTRFVARD